MNPKDFEQNLTSLAKGLAGTGGGFDPIEGIAQALEAGLGQGFMGGEVDGSPFAINKKVA